MSPVEQTTVPEEENNKEMQQEVYDDDDVSQKTPKETLQKSNPKNPHKYTR